MKWWVYRGNPAPLCYITVLVIECITSEHMAVN